MKIFAGTSNLRLSERIATYIKMKLGEVVINYFPDGEIFIKIKENIRGRDVFVRIDRRRQNSYFSIQR